MADWVNVPFPPENALLRPTIWPTGCHFDRVHARQFGAAEFNPGFGQARFSPLILRDGRTVPTLYAGENVAVALMETLLRDLPLKCAGYPVDMRRLELVMHSRLLPRAPLALLDLNPRSLKLLGITTTLLLGSMADHYKITQRWAAALYEANPNAQGLSWASRQHGGKALMLFGDRVNVDALMPVASSLPASQSPPLLAALEDLADEMALVLIN
ncbi:hypothetical protein AC790_09840 [Pantoea sp. RIT-PI-b]|uniref:RES family NAD+ phosphorylase n=1 Tax=Pantoea sp. RIT-PI-b TaxID=1681195 RepID=UPI00067609F1|nr:RES family NAD+ phosphorylase [Pantoea sp. RIT-PI-b]KNC13308.1 hypothetical protein AC790_09840 [Pantoea sp. RIT-PI-b]